MDGICGLYSGKKGWPLCLSAAVAILALGEISAPASSRELQPRRSEGCVTGSCHADVVGHRVMHGPVAQQKCEACHELEDEPTHRFSLLEEASTLCQRCHAISLRTFIHEPVREGRCTDCHDPHGSEHRMILREDPTRGLCRSCHADLEEGTKFVHGPVAAGACILCHEAHSSWHADLLIEPPQKLCLGCHAEFDFEAEQVRSMHAPAVEDCGTCHDAHGSDVRHQLHEEAPALCLSCHDDIREDMEASAVVHGAMTAEGGCSACHAPHSSSFPALQRDSESRLCLACHDAPLTASDGRMLTDMAALLRNNPSHHGPIRDGDCSACHQPHGSEHERLLEKAYPPEFYAPFSMERYELCFGCHIPDLVRSERGTGLTRFRDGDQNLHWLHVNREKGRTCRACHDVHASRNPFHIRDTVPFGKSSWELEIQFSRTATGGSCAPGCHVERAYDHGGAAEDASLSAGQPSSVAGGEE